MFKVTQLTVPEIFAKASVKETTEDKVKVLRQYDNKALRWYVNALYNTTWTIKVPDYTPSTYPYGNNFLTLSKAIPLLETIYKLQHQPGQEQKVENLLIRVLEGVHKEEALLLVKLIKQQRKVPGLSKSVFRRTYPSFFTDDGLLDG